MRARVERVVRRNRAEFRERHLLRDSAADVEELVERIVAQVDAGCFVVDAAARPDRHQRTER